VNRAYQAHPITDDAYARHRIERHARLRAIAMLALEVFVLGLGFVLFLYALAWGTVS
jgi:hypothetical protein